MSPRKSKKPKDEDPERLENTLPASIRNDNFDTFKQLLQGARGTDKLSDRLLANALWISCDHGRYNYAEHLLDFGVPPDTQARKTNKTALMIANSIEIARLLIDRGADPNSVDEHGTTALMVVRSAAIAELLIEKGAAVNQKDEFGRTALMHALLLDKPTDIAETLIRKGSDISAADGQSRTILITAAWKNRVSTLRELIRRAVPVNAKDDRGRTVLHHLCEDQERAKRAQAGKTTEEDRLVIQIILEAKVEINAAEFYEKKTALHLAVAINNDAVVKELLARPKTNVDSFDRRGKTPLHVAAANGRVDMATQLLRHGAKVNAETDRLWTPLHSACDCRGDSVQMVDLLLSQHANVKAITQNHKTLLHVAAEGGNLQVIQRLLSVSDIEMNGRDRWGNTPLLCAARVGHKKIVRTLARHSRATALSAAAIDASKGFLATILDFVPESLTNKNGNIRNSRTVYHFLSELYPVTPDHLKESANESDQQKGFRWIHLPANNVVWCQEMLVKWFIEQERADAESFKALEMSFNHEHRGQKIHAHYMRPVCQMAPRMPPAENLTDVKRKSSQQSSRGQRHHPVRNRNPTTEPPHSKPRSVASDDDNIASSNSMYMFMPYLNAESNLARCKMQHEIRKAQRAKNMPVSAGDKQVGLPRGLPSTKPHMQRQPTDYREESRNADENLIHAHVDAEESSLHIRRTLDQFFYRTIDTTFRDEDQVVFRYQKNQKPEDKCKLLMVDQLWMWVVSKDLIITAFPQRWGQPVDDQHNVLEGIIHEINSPTRAHITDVYELAMVIAGHCLGAFDSRNTAVGETLFLDMFESAIGDAMNEETRLFHAFERASEEASLWLTSSRSSPKNKHLRRGPLIMEPHTDTSDDRTLIEASRRKLSFVQTLLDIEEETILLREIKDIRDELDMLKTIFMQQETVLKEMRKNIMNKLEQDDEPFMQQLKTDKAFDELRRRIENPKRDIDRMDEQAKRIYNSIRDLLDLKQKHANAMQAADTARQGQTLMVFTVVTVIFLPLSFLAAFFAINIKVFPRGSDGHPEMSLGYVSKYVFGVGFAIALPCVVIALTVKKLVFFAKEWNRNVWSFWSRDQRISPRNGQHAVKNTSSDAISVSSSVSSSDGLKGRHTGVHFDVENQK